MAGGAKTKSSEMALPRIFSVRKCKVVVDTELARLYGVQTKRLNEAVRRNPARFPSEFSFVLTAQEEDQLKAQVADAQARTEERLRSQIATLKKGRGQHRKFSTRVFTEHGALMAATVLRSDKAVQMSLYLIRAFVEMREALLANATILKRLAEIDRRLVEHDSVLREIVERLQPLLDADDTDGDDDVKPKIGYHQGNR